MEDNIYSIASSANSHWNKDETVRYLCRYLSTCFMRYPEYFLASNNEQMNMFKKGFHLELPNIVCITLCEHLKEVFDEFGIESKIIQSTDSSYERVPLFSIIVRGNYCWYYIDPLYDLSNHQLGIRTNAYGYVCNAASDRIFKQYPFLENLPLSYIEQLDDRVGITHINDVFETDSLDVKNRYKIDYNLPHGSTLSQIIESKVNTHLNKYNNYGDVKGPIERYRIYYYFLQQIFNRRERKNLDLGVYKKENDYAVELKDTITNDVYRETKENGIYVMKKVKH